VTLPAYVERDGDWVLRPPGKLQNVSMWVFVFRAGEPQLERLCRRWIDEPSGGAVTARPVFPGFPFVMLVCADVGRGTSRDPHDAARGVLTERDMGLFVPVEVRGPDGATHLSNLIPYLFVDSLAGLVSGREEFGFPKLLGRMSWAGHANPITPLPTSMHFAVQSLVLPKGTHDVVEATVMDVRSLLPAIPIPVPAVLVDALALFIDAVETAIGIPHASIPPFAHIPQVFLKQFRDAAVPNAACHQSIVGVAASIDAFHGGAILPAAHYELTLPPYDGIDIAGTLGLVGTSPTRFVPLAALSAEIDFTLPYGTVLWP